MGHRMLTLRYLRHWHTRLNNLVFEGKLQKPSIVIEPCGPDAAGYAENTSPCTIYIDPGLSLREARIILLHEMVHQWQYQNGLQGNHGRSFTQWEEPCLMLTGLPLWL